MGRHTFERIDAKGQFHIEWSQPDTSGTGPRWSRQVEEESDATVDTPPLISQCIWPLFAYAAAVLLVVGGMLVLSHFLGPRHNEPATREPYESGNIPTGSARLRIPGEVLPDGGVLCHLRSGGRISYSPGRLPSVKPVGPGLSRSPYSSRCLLVALVYLWRQGALDWGPGPTVTGSTREK